MPRSLVRTLVCVFFLLLGYESTAAVAPETFTGALTIIHADDLDGGTSQAFYLIEIADRQIAFYREGARGEEIHADFSAVSGMSRVTGGLISGLLVRIRGVLEDGEIVLSEDAAPLLEILAPSASAFGSDTMTGNGSLAANSVQELLGANAEGGATLHPAIVILGNFQDDALPSTCTNEFVDNEVFGSDLLSVATNFAESSFDQVSFTGDTVGPYTLAVDNVGIDYLDWQARLQALAIANGVDLSAYLHQVYVLPSNSYFSGLGTTGIGGVGYGSAWVFRCDRPGYYAHEIGHNFETNHASRYDIATDAVSTYGDATDNMGSQTKVRHYNGPHKFLAGWLAEDRIERVTSDGIYVIRRIEEDEGEVMMLAIENLEPHVSPYDTDIYWVSYRVGVGTDSNLSSTYKDKVYIHEAASTPERTYLRTRYGLGTGEVFEEPAGSLSEVVVTVLSVDGEYATLQVTGVPPSAAPPIRALPTWSRVLLGIAMLACGAGVIRRNVHARHASREST